MINEYPQVEFIKSNGIRGFSENNNLALRQVKTPYVFVVNDDTEVTPNSIDKLLASFKDLESNVAVVSPLLKYPKGDIQFCGRPKHTIFTYIKSSFGLWDEKKITSVFINKEGLFKTYNISGAAFKIRTEVFKEMGWFDERYFFCPEDIALSTKLNEKGYSCYVNTESVVIHYEGNSGMKNLSPLIMATQPAGKKGSAIFFARGSSIKESCVSTLIFIVSFLQYMKSFFSNYTTEQRRIRRGTSLNVMKSIFTRQTPKEIFVKYYNVNKK